MEMMLEYSSSTTAAAATSTSPIETLVFNYVTGNLGVLFSTLNNFWAMIISVFSAVISLWGIKIISSISHHHHHHHHVESNGSPSISFDHNHQDVDAQRYTEESVHECVSQEEENVIVSSCSSWPESDNDSAVKFDGNVKRKFTLRFAIDNEGVNFNDKLTAVARCWSEVDVNDVTVLLEEDYCSYIGRSKWEKAMISKDLGWYNNQDLTSLNGSAVKLSEKIRR